MSKAVKEFVLGAMITLLGACTLSLVAVAGLHSAIRTPLDEVKMRPVIQEKVKLFVNPTTGCEFVVSESGWLMPRVGMNGKPVCGTPRFNLLED